MSLKTNLYIRSRSLTTRRFCRLHCSNNVKRVGQSKALCQDLDLFCRVIMRHICPHSSSKASAWSVSFVRRRRSEADHMSVVFSPFPVDVKISAFSANGRYSHSDSFCLFWHCLSFMKISKVQQKPPKTENIWYFLIDIFHSSKVRSQHHESICSTRNGYFQPTSPHYDCAIILHGMKQCLPLHSLLIVVITSSTTAVSRCFFIFQKGCRRFSEVWPHCWC